jgi:hypothetical protein
MRIRKAKKLAKFGAKAVATEDSVKSIDVVILVYTNATISPGSVEQERNVPSGDRRRGSKDPRITDLVP